MMFRGDAKTGQGSCRANCKQHTNMQTAIANVWTTSSCSILRSNFDSWTNPVGHTTSIYNFLLNRSLPFRVWFYFVCQPVTPVGHYGGVHCSSHVSRYTSSCPTRSPKLFVVPIRRVLPSITQTSRRDTLFIDIFIPPTNTFPNI